MDNAEHNELPAIVTDYIDAVIQKMRYRKSVRDDVRRELAGHFADALADCKDEDENERHTLAKELIEQFGDAKLLGVLLRRAKKRCRPLWRTMVVRTFQAVGAMCLVLLCYIGWFLTGKPVVTTNYVEVMNRLVRPVADDSQNAWPYYKQAAEQYIGIEDFDTPRRLSTLTQGERDTLNTWLADNRPSLELIRQGNQKPFYWQTYGHGEEDKTELISLLLPHLSSYRRMSYLLCWQALVHAHEGNMAAAFGAVLDAHRFGQHLRGQNTTLIEQLICIAIETTSTDTLRNLLSEYNQTLDVSLLDAARKQFEERVSKGNFTICVESEKLFMYDELQRSFTQPRFGKSHIFLPRLYRLDLLYMDLMPAWILEWSYYFVVVHPDVLLHPDRDETRVQAERVYELVEESARQTPASIMKQNVGIDKQIEELSRKNLFLNTFAPAMPKVVQLSYRGRTDSIATLAILAIVQYYKMQGDYPDSLTAAVEAGLLEEMPIDPFSDQPLVYRRTEDGFTLYSVGLNFTDDGGVRGTSPSGSPTPWADNGDAVFWPVAGREWTGTGRFK